MDIFLLSQVFAAIDVGASIIAFQNKDRTKMLGFFILGGLFYSTHFLLLEHYTAAALSLLVLVRLIVARRYPIPGIAAIFLGIQLMAAIFSYRKPIDLVAFAGTCFGTAATFQKDVFRLRILYLIAASLWFVHNLVVWTPMGMVAEGAVIASNLVGLFRNRAVPEVSVE